MDEEKKRETRINVGSSENLPTIDSANRARNKTVMLTPEMTGQMRARLAGDHEPPMVGQGVARLQGPTPKESDWTEPSFKAQGPVSLPGDDDEADWARPIEPAIMSDTNDYPGTNAGINAGINNGGMMEEPPPSPWGPDPTARRMESPPTMQPKAPLRTSQAPNGDGRMSHPQSPGSGHNQSAGKWSGQPAAPQGGFSQGYAGISEAPESAAASGSEEAFWKNMTPIVGFLVSFDHNPMGAYVELRSGRLMVSSEREASGNCLVIHDSSVSPMHAIMRVSGGTSLQILDQLSENGTRIKRAGSDEEEMLSGEKSTLSHGDVVVFGERRFHVCLLNISNA